ncbi:hypothetical protein QJQ45_019160, partial [Haematococcus lacustris]
DDGKLCRCELATARCRPSGDIAHSLVVAMSRTRALTSWGLRAVRISDVRSLLDVFGSQRPSTLAFAQLALRTRPQGRPGDQGAPSQHPWPPLWPLCASAALAVGVTASAADSKPSAQAQQMHQQATACTSGQASSDTSGSCGEALPLTVESLKPYEGRWLLTLRVAGSMDDFFQLLEVSTWLQWLASHVSGYDIQVDAERGILRLSMLSPIPFIKVHATITPAPMLYRHLQEDPSIAGHPKPLQGEVSQAAQWHSG